MQDVRLRTGVAVLLSVAAFLSLAGAAAAAVWCLVFARTLLVAQDMPGCSCRWEYWWVFLQSCSR